MKSAKLGAMFLISILALAGVGVGYAAWTDTITITGEVNTGSVGWHFSGYSSTYVWKNLDTDEMEITGEGEIVYWNSLLVAYAKAYEGDTDHHAIVEFYNLFPCVDFMANVWITYTGTVPGKLNSITFTDQWASDPNEDSYADEVAIDQHTTLDVTVYDETGNIVTVPAGYLGLQLHQGYTIHIVMIIHLPQDNTLMNLNGDFGVSAEIIQWNEYEL